MKKMTAEVRQSIETAASWQSHQQYDRSTVLMLLDHIKALEWEIESVLKAGEDIVNSRLESLDEALSDIGKHARTILNLNREKKRLEEEVDAAREGRKVTLPRKVVEAIEWLRAKGLTDIQIIRLSDQWSQLGRDYPEEVITELKVIRGFQLGDVLLAAFVNGYTVEQTPDDYVSEQVYIFRKSGQHDCAAAIEMVLEKLGKDELLHRLRNEVH